MKIRYKSTEKLIYNLAWRWSKKTNFSFEDLLSEANLIYVTKKDKYDPNKNKFSTFLYTCITNHFKNLVRNKKNKNKNIISIVPIEEVKSFAPYRHTAKEHNTPETYVTKQSIFNSLSNEAREVVNIIINCPAELFDELTSPVRKGFQKHKILKYCKRTYGSNKAGKIEKELKEMVSNF